MLNQEKSNSKMESFVAFPFALTLLPPQGRPFWRDSSCVPCVGILFLGSRRSRAELVHTLSCMPVLTCPGVTWRCLSQVSLTQTSGQKSSGHCLKMLLGKLTTYGRLGQKIMAQIYNRLPKSQEEKLGKILQELGHSQSIWVYRQI